MAKSQKGAGSPLLPIAIIAVAVFAAMAAVFTMTGTEPPSEATIIPEDVNAEPAGGGNTPEADVADTAAGATEQNDPTTSPSDSEPAPEEATPSDDTNGMDGSTGESSSAESSASGGDQGGSQGDGDGSSSDDEGSSGGGAAATVDDGGDMAGSGGSDGEMGDDPASASSGTDASEGSEDDFLLDESSDDPAGTPETTQPSSGNAENPEGRDAETQLDPESDQDVVRDSDEGGAAFVPTPSGPEGRDDEALTSE